MKRKVTITSVVLAVCLMVGSGVAAYAHPWHGGPGNNSRPSWPSWPGYNRMAPPSSRMMPPGVRTPPRTNTSMSAYEQYGLSFNREKRGYYYNGKLVGLFSDKQGRGITFLSQRGEIHVKSIRDSNGKLTGLAELTTEEYNEIIAEMNAARAKMKQRMERQFPDMRSRRYR